MSDGLTMIVVGVGVWAARYVGLPMTIINMILGGGFVVAGVIVMQGRRIQPKNEALGASLIRWGFWLFAMFAGGFVAHNSIGMAP